MKNEIPFEGCETCTVSRIDEKDIIGEINITCLSAHLWSHQYATLKLGQKYPEWCPLKDKIMGEKSND